MNDFICPRCGGMLTPHSDSALTCEKDSLTFRKEDGIWRFLTPRRIAHYRDFIRQYETIRRAEGRGSDDPAYFRALPFEDLSGKMPDMWRMRAASFTTFLQKVYQPRAREHMHVLDLGAGNGWLSNRLAMQGCRVDAVDILTNDWDGLGAHVNFNAPFQAVQASFDALPFKPHRYDLIVFNAAFHYSEDYDTTLNHVLRLLVKDGTLAVIDTPVYSREESGLEMVREREKAFKAKYTFPSNALPMENFLTEFRLERIVDTHHLQMTIHQPNFGLKHKLLPYRERLRGRREPARFPLIVLNKRK